MTMTRADSHPNFPAGFDRAERSSEKRRAQRTDYDGSLDTAIGIVTAAVIAVAFWGIVAAVVFMFD
jgi:hypothetical protein